MTATASSSGALRPVFRPWQHQARRRQSRQVAGNIGIGIGATGFIDVAGEYDKDDGTSRGATRPIAVIFAQQNPSLAQPAAQLSAAGADLGLVAPARLEGHAQQRHRRNQQQPALFHPVGAYNYANESFNYRSPNISDQRRRRGREHAHARAERRVLEPLLPDALPGGNATCPAGGYVNDNNTFSFTSILSGGLHAALRGHHQGALGNRRIEGRRCSAASPGTFPGRSPRTR